MIVLFQLRYWLGLIPGILAGIFLLRQLLMILAAEQGRKQDLVKKIHKPAQEFRLSLLIPFLDAADHPQLLALLHAIHNQEYSASRVSVHLVTSEETYREIIPQSLRANVKVWQYPAAQTRYEKAVAWLIERCLAQGGNGMFVFLKPTDMIKPDFLRNIAVRGLDSFAIQGYVALKNRPEALMDKVYGLSTRLFNRVANAGRYHLGASCRLLDSGWAIKQEVLEMIPYHRGMDLDNIEYTLRLNLENFRVNWAPAVVVYSDARVDFLPHCTLAMGAFLNRVKLLIRYGPRLFTRLLLRFDFNYLEQILAIMMPPFFLTFIGAVVMAVLSLQTRLPLPGGFVFWVVVAGLILLLDVMALVVSRCKSNDYPTLLFLTPLTYALSLLASPLSLYQYLHQAISNRPVRGSLYRRARKTRFNEDLAEASELYEDRQGRKVIHHLVKQNAHRQRVDTTSLPKIEKMDASFQTEASTPASTSGQADFERSTRETVRSVPVSNGKKQVHCRLRTLTILSEKEPDQESYCLILEYKSVSFATESYRIMDQAFYELQAKLMSRGLTIVSCGSCGHFYNPTADLPGAINNAGVCLFGKQGKDVNLNTDAVTVVSQACEHHGALEKRETIVRQWKESLTFTPTL